MNILLSSVGRRSYLVNYFRKALESSGGKVIGVNSERDTAGMSACDKAYLVPTVMEAGYIPALLEIAKKENVSMIVSLFDIDLPVLSSAKEMFKEEGIEVIVSSVEVIEIANDKWKTYKFFRDNEILTPKTFLTLDTALDAFNTDDLHYPVFIKPRFGMGSIGVYKAEDEEELSFFYKYVFKQISNSYLNKLSIGNQDELILIQEAIIGKEYGVDIFNNLEGEHLLSVVKEKIGMRSGETDGSIVIKEEKIEIMSRRISYLLKHIGNLDMDVMFNGTDYYALELNARFGGGFPFSYLAGADFPSMLVSMIKNEEIIVPEINLGQKSLKTLVPIVINELDVISYE